MATCRFHACVYRRSSFYRIFNALVGVQFVRQFYIAQWYRDCTMEAEKAAKKLSDDSSLRKAAETLAQKQQQINGGDKSDDDDDDEDEYDSQQKAALKKAAAELDSVKELQRKAERRKTFLMQLIAMRIGSSVRIKYVA